MSTTFTHNNVTYTITSYNSNVNVSWNHGKGQDYDYESIQWDNVCPTTEDKEEFDSEVDYIQDLSSYYLGELPTEVYSEAVRYAFSGKIADVLVN